METSSAPVTFEPDQSHLGQLVGQFGVLALIVVLGSWLWFGRMPAEGSIEARFARDMSAHHEQAVAMALALRERNPQNDLSVLTLDIVLTQQAQIGQMQGWLAVWGLPLAGSEPVMNGHGAMMGMVTEADIQSLKTLPPQSAEIRFLQLMIQHHQGGIFMAQTALKKTQRSEVRRLAQAIVDSQASEIATMMNMLRERGGEL